MFGKAHPCLLVVREEVTPFELSSENESFMFACVGVGVSLPRTRLSSPCVSCNLPDTRKAPSDSLLLGSLDSLGWGRIFISASECVRVHVRLRVFVWWVCNLSDTSWPRGRDTRGMMDNNSAFTGQQEQPRVTGWQQCLICLTAVYWWIKALMVNVQLSHLSIWGWSFELQNSPFWS